MNSKMTRNSQLSTTESRKQNKLSKHLEQEQHHRHGDHLEGYQLGRGKERMEGKVQGLKSTNCSYRIGMGMLRVSTGNGVATEVTCITHGHELRGNC